VNDTEHLPVYQANDFIVTRLGEDHLIGLANTKGAPETQEEPSKGDLLGVIGGYPTVSSNG